MSWISQSIFFQHCDFVEQLAALLPQAFVRLLQVEDVLLQQRDALNQDALPLGRRRAEDVGQSFL
jgi:hypothetical protein